MLYRLLGRVPQGVAMALFVVSGAACGSDGPEPPSDPCADSTLDYANFGKPFVSSYCESCHGGAVKGSARLGAPADQVFDTQLQIAAKASQLHEQVVVLEAMPFGTTTAKPSDAEREQFGRWLACLATEVSLQK